MRIIPLCLPTVVLIGGLFSVAAPLAAQDQQMTGGDIRNFPYVATRPGGEPLGPPYGFCPCDGSSLTVGDNPEMFKLIGGVGNESFQVPKMAPLAPQVNRYIGLPCHGDTSEPLPGEIRLFALARDDSGVWLPCRGQLLAVNRYQSLFGIIGNRFGGDGRASFALPKLPEAVCEALDGVPSDGLDYFICTGGSYPRFTPEAQPEQESERAAAYGHFGRFASSSLRPSRRRVFGLSATGARSFFTTPPTRIVCAA
jgi:microcystin-dependent protein